MVRRRTTKIRPLKSKISKAKPKDPWDQSPISFKLRKSEKEKFKKLAERKHHSVGSLSRVIIQAWIEENS